MAGRLNLYEWRRAIGRSSGVLAVVALCALPATVGAQPVTRIVVEALGGAGGHGGTTTTAATNGRRGYVILHW